MAALGRHSAATASGWWLVIGAVLGCQAAPRVGDTGPPVPAHASSFRAPEAKETPPPALAQIPPAAPQASLRYAEIATGGARVDEAAPLVIALHGLGDRPEHFLGVFNGFDAPAHVVAPRSETAHGPGYSWFGGGGALTDRAAPAIASMAITIVKFAAEMAEAQPTLGKPIIMGFSQGGALAFEIGVHHAAAIAATFPVGGWLTPALWPSAKPRGPVPLSLFHGTADTVVPFRATKTAALAMRELGFPLELHEYEGVGHEISALESRDLLAAIAAECEKQRQIGLKRGLPVRH
jgi:phospholipase/carboxylesterase